MPYNWPDYTTGNCGAIPTTTFTLISKTGNPPVYTIQANVSGYISVLCADGKTFQHPPTTTTFTDTTLTPYGLVDNLAPSITVQSYTFDGVNLNITFSILNGGSYPKNITLNTWAGTSTKSVTNPTNINPVSVQFQVSIPGSPNPTPLELYDSSTFDVFFNQSINSGTQGQNVGPIDILLQNGQKISNVILTSTDYVSLQNNTAPFVVLYSGTSNSVTTTPHTSSSANFTYTQIASMISSGTGGGTNVNLPTSFNLLTVDLSQSPNIYFGTQIINGVSSLVRIPSTILQSWYSAGVRITIDPSFNYWQYVSPGDTNIIHQANQSIAVTVQAVNGVQRTFYLSTADASGVDASSIILKTSSTQPISNTLQDVANFFQANNQSPNPLPQPTPIPTNLIANVQNDTIRLTWSSQYPVTLTMNGSVIVNNYAATAYSRFGVPNGTYTFTMFATNNGVNSNVIQVIAIVNYTPPAVVNNYAYNVQIPGVAAAYRFISTLNYGNNLTTGQPIPARQIAETALQMSLPGIPNTLNAIFVTNVSDLDNTLAFAQYLSTAFHPEIPPVVGPPTSTTSGFWEKALTIAAVLGIVSQK